MNILQLPSIGDFGVNAYILVSDSGNGALIDAPDDGSVILKALKDNNITLKKIILTHGHCDHFSACARIAEETGAQIHIHPADIKKLSNSGTNLTDYFRLPPIDPLPYEAIPTEDHIDFEGERIRILHTPGHTSGSVCYILDNNMFCGDTLFLDSMGRVDMPDGDEETMLETLAMLYDFEPETDYKLFSGHGENSLMSRERKKNRYMIYAHNALKNRSGE